MMRACLVAFALAAVLPAQAQGNAGPEHAERQLEAIRQALVESTLSAPVRVQSYGWIDTQGQLHESTQFTSDTRVRGVRVQSYLEDPAKPPTLRVQVDSSTLPAGVGSKAPSDPQLCLAQQRRWRQGLHVEVVARERLGGLLLPELVRLSAGVEQAFVAAARGSRRWVAQSRPAQGGSAYEQALFGRESDRSEWLARIELLEMVGGLVEAQIEITARGQSAPTRRLQLALPASDTEAMGPALAGAVAALDRQSACEPLWYSVVGNGDALRLREGSAHGLQPGDRLLLVERQHLPGRLLEPGAARAMALVQVGAPSAGGTPLRWLAGPRPATPTALQAPGDWVALPL